MSRHTRRKRLMSEINVVPYIDVMLVLLVIFMITAPLLTEGVIDPTHLHCPKPASDDVIGLVHDRDYLGAFRGRGQGLDERALKRIGLPWSPALVHRTVTAVGSNLHTDEAVLIEAALEFFNSFVGLAEAQRRQALEPALGLGD